MSEVVATAQQGLTGKYQPYPEYKDSGVEWLGDVPEHWVLSRVKDVAVVFGGYPFDSQRFSPDVGVPLIRIRDINTELTAVYFDGDVPQEAIVENNDVLIGMDGEFNVARWKGGKAALNQRVACVRTDSDELTTLLFYTLPFSLKVVNDLTYYTTVKHLSLEDIKKTIFALPQGEELSNIAAFLDYETARIDLLIAQQQRLIELLKEKRQAVISHAVTKGLNPNAPMKDSGVEWLGQVPEHWGVSALGYYSMLNTGATPDRSKNQYWGGTIPWIKTGEVRYDTIYETEETITQAALSETSVRLSKPGTLLMAMYGQGITRGRVAILGVSATYNQACVAITPNSKVTNDFLKFFFMAGYDALRDGGNETSQMNLNADIVSKFKVLVPSYEEQIDIVSFLRIKLAHYEQLINKSEHAIALLQERRTALISAAVTGKIDLRGWTQPAEEVAA
ncbi:restriction endonuclease subunit S [Aeromonas caviae]|uniref:restriction endonuclease subunit S n=1 Tax=Aeromonas caviae TaxID=648 RepID=UPI0024C66E3B|nr:restriction endonuclease subunit S [Aeromonas caviae]WAF62509.1 restriction endonuclease subunit S [Aeromonas caviae]WAF79347.1 restriction endonuclease subunit S [Aeromonas caviae]